MLLPRALTSILSPHLWLRYVYVNWPTNYHDRSYSVFASFHDAQGNPDPNPRHNENLRPNGLRAVYPRQSVRWQSSHRCRLEQKKRPSHANGHLRLSAHEDPNTFVYIRPKVLVNHGNLSTNSRERCWLYSWHITKFVIKSIN